MQIEVSVTDLNHPANTPFLSFGTDTSSGPKPGAVITMNPYVAAAKFVMSKNASDQDVKHTAAQIVSEIVTYLKSRNLLPAHS